MPLIELRPQVDEQSEVDSRFLHFVCCNDSNWALCGETLPKGPNIIIDDNSDADCDLCNAVDIVFDLKCPKSGEMCWSRIDEFMDEVDDE